jgi:hypothetical protein
MEWWIVAALAVTLVVMITVYRIAVHENRALTNYVLLILLGPKVHEAQRASPAEFVRATDAMDARDLGSKVRLATQSLAMKLAHTMLGVNGLLLKLKNSSAAAIES